MFMSKTIKYSDLTLEERMRILGNLWSMQQSDKITVFYELGYYKCQIDVKTEASENKEADRVRLIIVEEIYDTHLNKNLAKEMMLGYLENFYKSMYGKEISMEYNTMREQQEEKE